MINILIKLSEEKKVIFVFNDNCYEFNYDGFEKLIDYVVECEDEINVKSESEELNEYSKLLTSIVDEVRKEDFLEAVNKAKKNQYSLNELEEEYKQKY